MTKTWKILFLLCSGMAVVSLPLLYISGRIKAGEYASLCFYFFLWAAIASLTCLGVGILYYYKRMYRLHTFIQKTDLDILKTQMRIEALGRNFRKSLSPAILPPDGPWHPSEEMHHDFIDMLTKAVPTLTPLEQWICTLIYLYKTTQEIAELLHVDDKTIYNARSRLRQKLHLAPHEQIDRWVRAMYSESIAQRSQIARKASQPVARPLAVSPEPSEDIAEASVAFSEASEGMAETSATVSEASEQSAETSPIVSEASAGISPSSVSNS